MKRIILTSALTLLLATVVESSSAKLTLRSDKSKTPAPAPTKVEKRPTPIKAAPTRVIAGKYSKPITKMPTRHSVVAFKGNNYFVSNHRFYRKGSAGYIVVMPPAGLIVSSIMAAHHIFMYAGRQYYCAGGVIYNQQNSGEYVVVDPQPNMIVPELPEVELSVVDLNGVLYYQYANILYQPILTEQGTQYQVSLAN